VLEFAHVMAGPTCGLMLADLGADVVKVERIPDGDDTRRFVPPKVDGESAAFMMMNRNKRGIALDLKTPGGLAVAQQLIAGTDVLIENYRHGAMARLGLDFDSLSAWHRRLVYCSISGFGRTGPYAERAGFDLIAQAMSGLMSITGEGPGRPPIRVGAPITDITAGILAAFGIVAALLQREQTGEGQFLETSLFEAGIVHTFWQTAMCLATGVSPEPIGSTHPLAAPYQAFATADGWITIGAANQSNWVRLMTVLGRPEIVDDPRFADNERRMKNLPALERILSEILRQRPSGEWLDLLREAGVPAGPVLSIGGMLEDPQTIARQMVIDVQHKRLGKVKTLGPPVKFPAEPLSLVRGAPIFGEHTHEVLEELGYGVSEIEDLERQGAIVRGDMRAPDRRATVQHPESAV